MKFFVEEWKTEAGTHSLYDVNGSPVLGLNRNSYLWILFISNYDGVQVKTINSNLSLEEAKAQSIIILKTLGYSPISYSKLKALKSMI